MKARSSNAPASNTDYSSEPELLFSMLNGKPYQSQDTERSTQMKLHQESATLIQHAARLELESITLKESIETASDSLKEFPKEGLRELSVSMKAIKKDLALIKTKINLNHNLLQKGLDRVAPSADITKLIEKSTTNQEKLCVIVDKEIQTLNQSVKNVLFQADSIKDTQSHQNDAVRNIATRFEALDCDIKDIKQFLSLLVPRLILLEKSFVPHLSQLAAPSQMPDDDDNNDAQTKSKRRRLE
ncbi:hypothetical protein CANMA_003235 [Candida margitis]|uniref:uncharacterized protein n=1 Tax=Candida margitis TaxID=1775924 RepID=UPI0022273DE4|nr:uncharacterized protein CANMA_003235 [Candida margitis]KAI5967178.1 hypothetical protein CANMA_003235 [Candida margitis]